MAEFNGTTGDDVYSGTVDDDQIYGNAGKDQLSGSDGHDWIEGGAGDDIIFADSGSPEGNDIVNGGDGGRRSFLSRRRAVRALSAGPPAGEK